MATLQFINKKLETYLDYHPHITVDTKEEKLRTLLKNKYKQAIKNTITEEREWRVEEAEESSLPTHELAKVYNSPLSTHETRVREYKKGFGIFPEFSYKFDHSGNKWTPDHEFGTGANESEEYLLQLLQTKLLHRKGYTEITMDMYTKYAHAPEYLKRIDDFFRKTSMGRGPESPYVYPVTEQFKLIEHYGLSTLERLYTHIHPKSWADFCNLLHPEEISQEKLEAILEHDTNQYFINFALQPEVKDIHNIKQIHHLWKRSKWLHHCDKLSAADMFRFDELYGYTRVNTAAVVAQQYIEAYLLGDHEGYIASLYTFPNKPTTEECKMLLEFKEKYTAEHLDLKQYIPQILRENHLEIGLQRLYDLYTEFLNRFQRIPKIFPTLLSMNGINVKELVKQFDVASIKEVLSSSEDFGLDEVYKIRLAITFGKRWKEVVKKLYEPQDELPYIYVHSFLAGLPCPISDPELKNKIIKMAGKSSPKTIHMLANYWDIPGFPREAKIKDIISFMETQINAVELRDAKQSYPSLPWDTGFPMNLNKTTVHLLQEEIPHSARVLNGNDPMQLALGRLSSCCQRLGGVGEASMMEGLVNPQSGFLVFERGYSKLLAQSWIWESKQHKFLVLDNIEFADNRSLIHILPLLRSWLEASPYENIQVGIGYTNLNSYQLPPVDKEDMDWYKAHWHAKYTDAHQRVWLKKDNKILL